MRFANFIEDGQTRDGFIDAVPGLHEALGFSYRPMLPEEQAAHTDKADKFSGQKWIQFTAAQLAPRIVSMDGQMGAVTAACLLRLQPRLFGRLRGIVLGIDPSDINPAWAPDVAREAAEEEFASALSGRPLNEVRDEASVKN